MTRIRHDYLVGLFELREEIPDLLVSTAFLSERLLQPLKFVDSGQEIMNLAKMPIKTEKFDLKRLESLYDAYLQIYTLISRELARLCCIAEKTSFIPISPRLSRWWARWKQHNHFGGVFS